MKHIGALLLKFVITAAVLELILLNTTQLSFGSILVISATVTVVAYLLGDLAILPNSNNTIATAADIGLALLTIMLFNFAYPGAGLTFAVSFLACIGVGIGEWVFHKFMAKIILPDRT